MSENRLPLLTICVPTYDRAVMLDQCLEALYDIQAKGHDFCLIVADNGSPDNTKEVIAKWIPRFNRAEAIYHDTNLGSDRNFYSLYVAVKTEYCWMLGDTNYISEEHFSMMEEHIRRGYDAVVINTDVSMMKLDSKVYTKLAEFLDEQFWHITKNSSFVLTRKALDPALMRRYFDSCFIHLCTFVEYLCQTESFRLCFDKDIRLRYLKCDEAYRAKPKGSWRQIPFSVWGKCFSTMVLSLPLAISYEQKLKIMKDHERQFHWFSVRELVRWKFHQGKPYVEDYKKNRRYVHMVSVASPFLSDLVMYMPTNFIYGILGLLNRCKSLLKRQS